MIKTLQSKLKLFYLFLACTFILNIALAQSPPNLGTTSTYALFTAIGAFNNTGATVVTGDIGTNAGIFSGFPPVTVIGVIHLADASTLQAANDVNTAYNF